MMRLHLFWEINGDGVVDYFLNKYLPSQLLRRLQKIVSLVQANGNHANSIFAVFFAQA
jgi:hypothetical protein